MKTKIQLFVLLFAASFLFVSCGDDEVQNVPVESVTLNYYEITVAAGAPAVNLIATIAPANATNQDVAWISSDKEVAVVVNGAVTGISAGTATITVTTEDGAHTASAEVTVTPPPVFVTGVTLDRNTLELAVGATAVLTADVAPADATNPAVTWASSNPGIAAVDEYGKVTAVTAGTATITVTTEDGGKTTSCEVTVIEPPVTDPGIVVAGIRWATRNVDMPGTFALNPEDAGMFFQWNSRIGWSTTDPMINTEGGTVWDSSIPYSPTTRWERENDPCPPGWRVPTQQEFIAIENLVTWTANWNGTGVAGRVYGTAPNQLFFPAAGGRTNRWENGALVEVNTDGNYWTAGQGFVNYAWTFWFNNILTMVGGTNRGNAQSVRCVAE